MTGVVEKKMHLKILLGMHCQYHRLHFRICGFPYITTDKTRDKNEIDVSVSFIITGEKITDGKAWKSMEKHIKKPKYGILLSQTNKLKEERLRSYQILSDPSDGLSGVAKILFLSHKMYVMSCIHTPFI